MNIAIFSDTYKPIKNGVVTVVDSEKKSLEKLGHKVFLFTIEYPDYTDEEKRVYRFRSISGSSIGTENRLAVVDYRRVFRIIKRNKIDIIHNHTEFTLGTAAYHAAKRYGIPIIMTTHTDWEHYYRHYFKVVGRLLSRRMVHQILRRIVHKSDYLLCPSQKIKDYYEKVSPKRKSVLIPNGLEVSDFLKEANTLDKNAIRQSMGLGKDDVVGVFVGRVSKEKRAAMLVSELIKAFKQMETKNAKFIVVGEGHLLEQSKKIVEENGLQEQFIFTGFVQWEQIYKLYAIADYYATASISEVAPITVLEALFSGLPMVGANDEALSDKLYHNENGYLVEDDSEFFKYIIKMCENSAEQRQAFSKKSLEIANTFAMETHIKRLLRFYEYMIEKYREDMPYDEDEINEIISNIK